MNRNENLEIIDFIKSLYPNENNILLHAPKFLGNEKKYLVDCIDSTFVSYVGKYVVMLEEQIIQLNKVKNAIAFVNGTTALQLTLQTIGATKGTAVITQALTFVATVAAICHTGADPVFIDVDLDTMSMSPIALKNFLVKNCEQRTNGIFSKKSGLRIVSVVPMHTFGHIGRIEEIKEICDEFNIELIEDAAEALGSTKAGQYAGTFGRASILSFNGNKTVTTGGGGMVITNDDSLANNIKHLSTTAKLKHKWEFIHDQIGYNLRMPNVNAAVGCAQMEYFDKIFQNKRETAKMYETFFANKSMTFFCEPDKNISNYWLNSILFKDRNERNEFLEKSNNLSIQTRTIWTLMHKLTPYENFERDDLINSQILEDRVVNIPSGLRIL